MISVDEALRLLAEAVRAAGPLPAEEVDLPVAAGRILRERIVADRDLPPFTRSAMDGYAVRAADTAAAPVRLEVIEEIPAGRPPARAIGAGQASRIMTGAMIPEGADAVQMVEKTAPDGAGAVRILEPVRAGEHVRRAGEDLTAGSELLEPGAWIGPAALGLLASCGRARVAVSRRPRVALLPTGDELVPVSAEPAPSQIRESNAHALAPLVDASGGLAFLWPIVADRIEPLRAAVSRAMREHDVVVLTGGVSMGDYDFVGEALAQEGVRPLFTRIAIQPGKPCVAGLAGPEGRTLVFGLPGNPVSSLVDFMVFARPALRLLQGATRWRNRHVTVTLPAGLRRHPGRRGYLPASLREPEEAGRPSGPLAAELIPSRGSADLVALSRADALVIAPEEAGILPPGVTLQALLLRGGGAA
jgi:molybdopterin molybdotransferase